MKYLTFVFLRYFIYLDLSIYDVLVMYKLLCSCYVQTGKIFISFPFDI